MASLTEAFLYMPRSLQTHAEAVSRVEHDKLLPNPFQFISHSITRRYIARNTNSVVKESYCIDILQSCLNEEEDKVGSGCK
jgi:hypothetical protein